MAITKEDIIQAAETLEADGQNATMKNVRDYLGSGSFATISPVLREWKESRKTTTAIALEMPGELKAAAERMEAEFWQTASKMANEKLVVVQAEADAAVNAAESEREEALEDIARLEKELSEATESRQEAETDKESALQQVSAQKAEIIRLQEQLTASQNQQGQLKDDLKQMTLDKDRQAEEASRLDGLYQESKGALEKIRQQYQHTDELYQSEKLKVANLENNLEHLIGEKEVLTETSNSQTAELLKIKTTLSGLEARVDDRNIKIAQLEKETSELQKDRQQVASLKAELDASKSRIRELATETGELKQENKSLHKEVGHLQGQLSKGDNNKQQEEDKA